MSKRFEPTDEQRSFVKMAVVAGFVQDDICKGVINPETSNPIDMNTLQKHFRREIDEATIETGTKVAKSLVDKAIGGDVTAQIWYTKSRLGWKSAEKFDDNNRPQIIVIGNGKGDQVEVKPS